jgi:hypothetical protein
VSTFLTGNSGAADAGLLNPKSKVVQMVKVLRSTPGMREALTGDFAAATASAELDASTARDAAVDADFGVFMITPDRTLTHM